MSDETYMNSTNAYGFKLLCTANKIKYIAKQGNNNV